MSAAPFHAVILAGGRGTRFWPRSRKRTPKQLLNVFGHGSLLQQTVARLSPLAPPERTWVLTSDLLRNPIRKQLPDVPAEQIVAEPVQRNTGPAIALAARLILEKEPNAVMGVFPSDHLVADEEAYRKILERAIRAAAKQGSLIVLGLEPRYPETGYGYIQFPKDARPGSARPAEVKKFHEKPEKARARRFVKEGNYYWNSGMFVWKAEVIRDEVNRFLKKTAAALTELPPLSSRRFKAALKKAYPQCDDISIDKGVLEKSDNIAGFPCKDFGWNDIGGWEAVYGLAEKDPAGNAMRGPVELLNAKGNYVDAPGKFVALVDVHDLIVVDTKDALLICPRAEAQKVSALVKALENAGWESLL